MHGSIRNRFCGLVGRFGDSHRKHLEAVKPALTRFILTDYPFHVLAGKICILETGNYPIIGTADEYVLLFAAADSQARHFLPHSVDVTAADRSNRTFNFIKWFFAFPAKFVEVAYRTLCVSLEERPGTVNKVICSSLSAGQQSHHQKNNRAPHFAPDRKSQGCRVVLCNPFKVARPVAVLDPSTHPRRSGAQRRGRFVGRENFNFFGRKNFRAQF